MVEMALERKKSKIMTQIETSTTALVTDRPTPTVPPLVVRPFWQATLPIISPKKIGFTMPPMMSSVPMPPHDATLKEFLDAR